MKFTYQQSTAFQPISINVELENLEEAMDFYHRLQINQSYIRPAMSKEVASVVKVGNTNTFLISYELKESLVRQGFLSNTEE